MADRALTERDLDDLDRVATAPCAPEFVDVPRVLVLALVKAERARRGIALGINLERRFWTLVMQDGNSSAALRTVVQEAIAEDRKHR